MSTGIRLLSSVLICGLCIGLFFAGLAPVESASAQDSASAEPTVSDAPDDVAEPPASEPIDDAQLEVLTRGPVHEAFAEQVNRDPEPGLAVEKAPPEAVREVPPEYKPDGDNVSWIPGYWAWDEDRNDYIWVSGVWRNAPPQRDWVPGYWHQTANGYQWVSGYWAAGPNGQTVDAVEYLDVPPESLEQGPSYDAPSDEHFWVPGCWVYSATGYNWRPGYWQTHRPNWIWVPDRYSWTPAGCVYVNGYWDHRLPYRGQLFAPVYFNDPLVYRRPHYYYRPGCVIDVGRLHLHLFACPRYHHYYFGDYHGSSYLTRGYYPHFSFHLGGYGYDPLFTYYHHDYRRRGIDYAHRLHGWHRYYASHRDLRPPRSYGAQRDFERRHRGHQHLNQAVLARQFSDEVRSPRHNRRFVQLADDQQRVQRERTQEIRASQARRAATEARQRSRPRARQLSGATPRRPQSSIRDGATSIRDRANGRGPRARGTDGRVTTDRQPGSRQPGNRATAQGNRPAVRGSAPNAVASPSRDPRYSSGGSRNYKRALDLARQRQQAAASQRSNLQTRTRPATPRTTAPSAGRNRPSARTVDPGSTARARSQAIRSLTSPSTSAGRNTRQSAAKPPVTSSRPRTVTPRSRPQVTTRSRTVTPRSRPQATSRPSVSPRRGSISSSRSPSRQGFSPSSQRAQRTLQSNRNLSSGTRSLLQTQSSQRYMDRRKAYSTMRRSQPSARSSRPAPSARSSSGRASSARASASRARASASRSRGGGGKGK